MLRHATKFPILTGASWYFLEKLIRLIGAFLIGAWVARHLGPESYGALAYALALVAALGFLGSLGIESLVVRDLVAAQRDPKSILSTYFVIRLGGALLVPLLATGFLMTTHAGDSVLLLLTVLCGIAVVFGACDTADCWLQARNEARKTSLVRLTGFTVGSASRCLLILINAPVEWFAVVVLLESAVIAALYLKVLREHGLTPHWKHVSLAECKHLVVAGKMIVLSGVAVAIYSKIDVLVVGAVLSKEAVGAYAIAASMCAAWNMVAMSVAQAWAPRISHARVHSQREYLRAMRQLLLAVSAISLSGALVISWCAEFIFALLLGPSYMQGAAVLRVLVWSSVFVFLGVATSQIIVNERIYWVSMLRTLIGLVFCLIVIVCAPSQWDTVDFAYLMVCTSAIATSAITLSAKARKTLLLIVNPS